MNRPTSTLLLLSTAALGVATLVRAQSPGAFLPPAEGEKRVSNIRQITNGGENAEAYFSARRAVDHLPVHARRTHLRSAVRHARRRLRRPPRSRPATARPPAAGSCPAASACSSASSHAHDATCPPKPDPSAGYVWPLDQFDIYTVNRDGTDLKRLTNYNVYTAEGVLSPDGKTHRVHVAQGRRSRHLHHERRRHRREQPHHHPRLRRRPVVVARREEDRLSRPSPAGLGRSSPTTATCSRQSMIRPSRVELFVDECRRQRPAADHRAGRRQLRPVVDARRQADHLLLQPPRSAQRQLRPVPRRCAASKAGPADLERITFDPTFDGFPMFRPDGKKLIWASNRHSTKPGETNLFIADWK